MSEAKITKLFRRDLFFIRPTLRYIFFAPTRSKNTQGERSSWRCSKFHNKLVIFLLSVLNIFSLLSYSTRVEIVVPTYKNQDVCIANLRSLVSQDYPRDLFHITIVDDMSPDSTNYLIKKYIDENNLNKLVKIITNKKRTGALGNFYKVIHDLPGDTVVFTVDGDDELNGPNVVKRVIKEYEENNAWVTYGQFKWLSSGSMGICRDIPDDVKKRNAFRSQSWVFSHLRTFKAWLFQQIKFEDLLCPATLDNRSSGLSKSEFFYDKAWDLSLMFPMLEMARDGHIRYIPDVLYIYNDMSPLNDHKVDAGRVVALDAYARKRKKYDALSAPVYIDNVPQNIDLIVYSKDRPLQLLSFLESLGKYATGVNKVFVVYASSDAYEPGYKEVFEKFNGLTIYRQNNNLHGTDFKQINLDIINQMVSNYVAFAVDDIVVKDRFDFAECAKYLRHTDAYGFYLRLGDHVDYCYTENRYQGVPHLIPVSESMGAWRFSSGQADWNYPNCLDMTVYKKATAISAITNLNYRAPNSMEGTWAGRADHNKIGLCYYDSKIVNLPLNLVNTEITGNRHMHSYSVAQLYDLFRRGFKMDINKLEKIKNRSAHMEYEPSFIAR